MFKRKSVLMVVVTLMLGYFLFSCSLLNIGRGDNNDTTGNDIQIVEGNNFFVGQSYPLNEILFEDKKFRNTTIELENDKISRLEDNVLHVTGFGKITLKLMDKNTLIKTQTIEASFKDRSINDYLVNNYINEGYITEEDFLNVKEIRAVSEVNFIDDLKFFNNLEVIKIVKGNFDSVYFDDYPNLHTIEITNGSLINFSVTNAPSLKYLNLESNKINASLNIDNDSNVEFINVSGNPLSETLDFSKLTSLKELYINRTAVKKVIIPDNLEKLEAMMTSLESVITFDDFSVLEYLNMKGTEAINFVLDLPTSKLEDFDVFYGSKTKEITIKGTHPNIKNISINNSELKRVTVFNINNIEVIKVESSSLERFNFKGTSFESLNTISYDGYSYEVLYSLITANYEGITNLAISNFTNQEFLHELPNLKNVTLTNVNMKNWNLIKGSPNLESINLYNSKVNFVVERMMESIKKLSLKSSSTIYLDNIDKFNKLDTLQISDSDLTEFNFGTNFDNLVTLNLSSNKMSSFNINFDLFPNLSLLDISNNKLEDVTLESRSDVNTKIDLSDNKIKELSIAYPFTDFSNVNLVDSFDGTGLNLYIKNQITSRVISDDMLKGLDGNVNIIFAEDINFSNVIEINLTNITKLYSMELNGHFDNLNTIDISSSNFKTIKANRELFNLTTLNITNNSELEITLDSNFKSLENISFANSVITKMTFDEVYFELSKMDLLGDYTFDWYITNNDEIDSLEIVSTKEQPYFNLKIGNLPNLEILDLSKSNIKGIDFTGELNSLLILDLSIGKVDGSLIIDTSYIVNIKEIKLPKVITGVLHFKGTENKFQELIFDSEISEIILEGVFNQLHTIDFGSSNNSIRKLTLDGQFDNLETVNLREKLNFRELVIMNDIPSLKVFDISDSKLNVNTYVNVLNSISKLSNLELLKVYNNGSFYYNSKNSRYSGVSREARLLNKIQQSNQNIEIYYRSEYELFSDFGYVVVKNASDFQNAFQIESDTLFIDTEYDLIIDMNSYNLTVKNSFKEIFINVSEISNLSMVFEENSSVELNLNVSTITTRTNTNLINSLNVNNLRLNIYKSLIIKPNSYTNIGSNINGADVFRAKNLDINLFANLDIRAEDGKDSNIRDFTSPGNGGTVFKVNETVNISGNYGITLKAGCGGNAVNSRVPDSNYSEDAKPGAHGANGSRGIDARNGGRAGYIVESNIFNVSTFKLVVVENRHGDGGNGSSGQKGQTGGRRKTILGITSTPAGNGGNGGDGGNGGNAYGTTLLYNSKFTDINPSTSSIGVLSSGTPGKGGQAGSGGSVLHKSGKVGNSGSTGNDGIIIR